jgi:hypothetical protein
MGIVGDVNIAEFPLYFCPLEQDVLSLELENSFSDLYLVRLNACHQLPFANEHSTKIQALSLWQLGL